MKRSCNNCGNQRRIPWPSPYEPEVVCVLEEDGGRPCVNGLTDWIPAETLNEDERKELGWEEE